MINENENDSDGIINVIKYLHQYVPYHGDEEERRYGDQAVVGDQLSVERGINGHMSLANGFIPEEKAKGLHFEIADWHAGNKFLEVNILNVFTRKNTMLTFMSLSYNILVLIYLSTHFYFSTGRLF